MHLRKTTIILFVILQNVIELGELLVSQDLLNKIRNIRDMH